MPRLLFHHLRILVSTISLAMAFLSSHLSAAECLPAQAKQEFQVLDATLFSKSSKPALSVYGIKHLPFLYAQFLWPKGTFPGAPEELHEETIRKTVSQFRAGDIVAVDIEHWPLSRAFDTPLSLVEANIPKFKRLADIMHDEVPGLKIGYYAFLPSRNYWAPVTGRQDRMTEWQEDNARLKVIPVDVIFPSLYTFYGKVDDPEYKENWVKYAKANIAQAKQYGAPIYPVIWFQYHDSNEKIGGQPVDPGFWRLQLETLRDAGVDGVVLWGGWTAGRPGTWDENAPWWVATKKFIENLAEEPQVTDKSSTPCG
ncbi:MAG: hypothetical protein ACREVE_12270 [Gammaproteobacteria bacterium]